MYFLYFFLFRDAAISSIHNMKTMTRNINVKLISNFLLPLIRSKVQNPIFIFLLVVCVSKRRELIQIYILLLRVFFSASGVLFDFWLGFYPGRRSLGHPTYTQYEYEIND